MKIVKFLVQMTELANDTGRGILPFSENQSGLSVLFKITEAMNKAMRLCISFVQQKAGHYVAVITFRTSKFQDSWNSRLEESSCLKGRSSSISGVVHN